MKVFLFTAIFALAFTVGYLLSIELFTTPKPDAQTNVNYRVFPMNSREVIVNCTNGAQPLVSTQADKPNLVEIKCMDVKQ